MDAVLPESEWAKRFPEYLTLEWCKTKMHTTTAFYNIYSEYIM